MVDVVAVRFAFRLTGAGWADATISDGEQTATLSASYLGDALGDLLKAVLAIIEGSDESRCSWWEEPGKYRWLFSRREESVRLTVLWFHDWDEPDENGMPVFHAEGSLGGVAGPIVDEAERVLSEYGEENYLARWVMHPFPTETLRQLQARLA